MFAFHRIVRRHGAVVLTAAAVSLASAQEHGGTNTVWVLAFDQLAVTDGVHEVFGGDYDLGRGIAQLVRQRLAEQHHVVVVESEAEATGSVAGAVLAFGKAGGDGEVGGVSVGRVRVGLGRKKEKAIVALEARLIDKASGEVVGAVTGHGESERGEWKLSARAKDVDLASLDLSGDAFKKTSIGDATHQAIGEISAAIASYVPQLGTIARRAPIAPPAPVSGGMSVGGSMGTGTWMPYLFRGTEHFRYDVTQTEDEEVQSGYYQLSLQPAGENRVRMSVEGELGDEAYSSTVTTGVGSDGMQMGFTQFMTLGPIGFTLFNPAAWIVLAGHDLTVGDGWSWSSDGETLSVRVESDCSHAGVSGALVVVTENGEMRQQSCVSPEVALPLRVQMNDQGSMIDMTLVEYRP